MEDVSLFPDAAPPDLLVTADGKKAGYEMETVHSQDQRTGDGSFAG